MGIQDDIFDVSAVVDLLPEAKAFDRIIERFSEIEASNERMTALLTTLENGQKAALIIERGSWRGPL